MKRTLIAAAALSLFGAGAALAGPQFSADTVQIQPGQEMRSGRLYVSDKGVRFEFQQDGQPVVQLMLPSQNVLRVMFPLSRTYIEVDVPHGATLAETRPDVPCKASTALVCVKEGDDPARADVQRWTIRMKNAPGAIRVWWDAKRKMAVREEYMDGRVMQATLRGPEPYEGRQVEGWEIVYMTPNGQYRRAMSLYAPELGIAVVEQQPGGVIRELRNVQIGAPDPKLFALPENYKKVEAQASPDAETANATGLENQAPAAKTNNRLAPTAAAPEPQPQPQPQQSQQSQGMGPFGMMPGPMMMQGPGMMIAPPQPQQPQPQQTQPQQPQAQPQPQQAQPEAAPGPAVWTQPRQAPPPQWGQPYSQPQAAPQPPFYPGYGQHGAPSSYTDPGQPPAAQPAPQSNGANSQPTPGPVPPFHPGYGMQPGPFGPYGHPGFAPMQPPAPAPEKAATTEPGASQVQPGAPATTSARGGKKP